MSETTEKKKVRRLAEERVPEIDSKIAAHKDAIKKLEEKKQAILNPKPRLSKAQKVKLVIDKAKNSGMSVEEIAEKLGVTFE